MKKRICIVGNWKMNPQTLKDAEKLFTSVLKTLPRIQKSEIVICPPFIYLEKLRKLSKKISLGAQDAFFGDTGAFTGEISPSMIEHLGMKYVILGHSERRNLGEDNTLINKKIKSSLQAGLTPILCIGENTRDDSHEYFNLVQIQLEECLRGVSKNSLARMVIAYEPVWALSSTIGRHDATPPDCKEMVIFIKKVLADKFGGKAELPRIIYGGSANEKDALDFLQHGGVDGLLPGRASLDAKKFSQIVKIAETL